jgi:hypothetical protein
MILLFLRLVPLFAWFSFYSYLLARGFFLGGLLVLRSPWPLPVIRVLSPLLPAWIIMEKGECCRPKTTTFFTRINERLCLAACWYLNQSCKWNDRSLNRDQESRPRIETENRDRESVATLLYFGLHVRISISTITFDFLTISVSVSPLIFLQR